MPHGVLVFESTARYATTADNIRHLLLETAEQSGIAVDDTTLTGKYSRWLFQFEYEWRLEPGDEDYVVVETRSASSRWLLSVVVPSIILALYGVSYTVPRMPWTGLWLLTVVTFPAAIGAGVVLASLPSVLWRTREVNAEYQVWSPAAVYLPVLAVGIILGIPSITPGTIPGSILLLCTGAVLWVKYDVFRLIGERIGAATLPFGPILLVKLLFLIPVLLVLELSARVQAVVVAAGLTLGLLWFLTAYLPSLRGAYHGFRKGEQRQLTTRAGSAGYLLLHAAAGYTFVYLYFQALTEAAIFTDPFSDLWLLGSLVVVGLPLGIHVAGLTVQTAGFLTYTGSLFRRSTPVDSSYNGDVAVREVPSTAPIAGSFSSGFYQCIFLSTALRAAVGDDELDAILAHEAAHVQNGDALLSCLVPVLSPVLLTGKNVVFGGLNFREREFQADREAVDATSAEALMAALSTIETWDTSASVQHQFGLAPTFASFHHLSKLITASCGRSR